MTKLLPVLFLFFPFLMAAQQPTVSDVRAEQVAGSKTVEIRYNLAIDGGDSATVTVKASRDNGATYEEVPDGSLSGAFGRRQSAGTNKTIVWDAAAIGWEAALYPQTRVRITATVPAGMPADMVRVQGGTLSTSNELDGTVVDTFFIGKYEVTWGEWKAVRSWAASNGYDIGRRGEGCADDHPVHTVWWHDVVKWCNAKSEMEGLEPVYSSLGATWATYRSGKYLIYSQDRSASGYRLPMEAEWEFAARGGTQTNGYEYAGSNDPEAVGWYRDNSGGAACDLSSGRGTWPVGQKAANELGLYDMSGNVYEWCWERALYQGGSGGSGRRLRGGSWKTSANLWTVSFRGLGNWKKPSIGFRLVRRSDQ
jgi:formylglycine-generating enzyme required for sulfatase activity